MLGKYFFEIQSFYPHMKPHDVHLWEQFIRANAGFFDKVDYDILVGDGVVMGDIKKDVYAKSFKILTQKKIDVVGYIRNEIWIVEVKPFASSSALGQLLTYRLLYDETYSPKLPVKMMIITNQLKTDYNKVFSTHGIYVAEVGICPQCNTGIEKI